MLTEQSGGGGGGGRVRQVGVLGWRGHGKEGGGGILGKEVSSWNCRSNTFMSDRSLCEYWVKSWKKRFPARSRSRQWELRRCEPCSQIVLPRRSPCGHTVRYRAPSLTFMVETVAAAPAPTGIRVLTIVMPRWTPTQAPPSPSYTSMAAPPSFPDSRASISEAVFTRPPRPQLITMAPSFMLAMLQNDIRASLSSVWQCKAIEHRSAGVPELDPTSRQIEDD